MAPRRKTGNLENLNGKGRHDGGDEEQAYCGKVVAFASRSRCPSSAWSVGSC